MKEIYLKEIAHGRSGDKGDTSNVCVYARREEYYPIIKEQVTTEKCVELRETLLEEKKQLEKELGMLRPFPNSTLLIGR